MRIFCIANFKGGTGKTVTACNLAAILARDGSRVLLIDADAQHNASDFFQPGWEGLTLTDLLTGREVGAVEDWLAEEVRPGIDLLCADMGLLTLDLASILNDPKAGCGERDRILFDFLQRCRRERCYDYCIIDCPPSFTSASVAALVCADEVILPTRVDAYSRAGALELIGQVRGITHYNLAPSFRVLVTMVDTRARLSAQAEAQLRRDGLDVCETVIHNSASVSESSYTHQPLFKFAPGCRAAQDYEALAQELAAKCAEGRRS